MKSTGIIRKVDDLGRIVLPVELRKNLDINIKDKLEIFISNDKVVLKKFIPADIFNGEDNNLIEYYGKKVSKKSILEMAQLAGFNITNKDIANVDDIDDLEEKVNELDDDF